LLDIKIPFVHNVENEIFAKSYLTRKSREFSTAISRTKPLFGAVFRVFHNFHSFFHSLNEDMCEKSKTVFLHKKIIGKP